MPQPRQPDDRIANSPAKRLLASANGSASDLDATDFEWNDPDEECEPDFTLDDLEWSEIYE